MFPQPLFAVTTSAYRLHPSSLSVFMCKVNSYQNRGLELHVGVSNPHERSWTKCSDDASVDNFPRPPSFRLFFGGGVGEPSG